MSKLDRTAAGRKSSELGCVAPQHEFVLERADWLRCTTYMDSVGSEGGALPCHGASSSPAPPPLFAYSAKGLTGICKVSSIRVSTTAMLTMPCMAWWNTGTLSASRLDGYRAVTEGSQTLRSNHTNQLSRDDGAQCHTSPACRSCGAGTGSPMALDLIAGRDAPLSCAQTHEDYRYRSVALCSVQSVKLLLMQQ